MTDAYGTEEELQADEHYERMQAYWASPEGVEAQRREFVAAYASVGEPVPSCSRSNGVIVCCSSVPVGPTREDTKA